MTLHDLYTNRGHCVKNAPCHIIQTVCLTTEAANRACALAHQKRHRASATIAAIRSVHYSKSALASRAPHSGRSVFILVIAIRNQHQQKNPMQLSVIINAAGNAINRRTTSSERRLRVIGIIIRIRTPASSSSSSLYTSREQHFSTSRCCRCCETFARPSR